MLYPQPPIQIWVALLVYSCINCKVCPELLNAEPLIMGSHDPRKAGPHSVFPGFSPSRVGGAGLCGELRWASSPSKDPRAATEE